MRDPVVLDTVTVREFAESGRLDLMHHVFTGPVHVPAAVQEELRDAVPYAPAVRAVLSAEWIEWDEDISDPRLRDEVDRLRRSMSRDSDPPRKNLGEAQVMITARELGAAVVCIDDYDAARIAKGRFGLRVIGTVRILQEGVSMDHIRCDDAVALYAEMRVRQRNWPDLGPDDLCA